MLDLTNTTAKAQKLLAEANLKLEQAAALRAYGPHAEIRETPGADASMFAPAWKCDTMNEAMRRGCQQLAGSLEYEAKKLAVEAGGLLSPNNPAINLQEHEVVAA